MRAMRIVLVMIAAAVLAGCASGPKFEVAEKTLPALSPGKARIFFYRPSSLGAAIQPEVRLNGTVVGKAEPNGVFYVDRDPGNMEVVTGSEIDRKLTFTVGPGETRYVKLGVGLGVVVFRIIPELMSAEQAKAHMADLAFVGPSGAAK